MWREGGGKAEDGVASRMGRVRDERRETRDGSTDE